MFISSYRVSECCETYIYHCTVLWLQYSILQLYLCNAPHPVVMSANSLKCRLANHDAEIVKIFHVLVSRRPQVEKTEPILARRAAKHGLDDKSSCRQYICRGRSEIICMTAIPFGHSIAVALHRCTEDSKTRSLVGQAQTLSTAVHTVPGEFTHPITDWGTVGRLFSSLLRHMNTSVRSKVRTYQQMVGSLCPMAGDQK